MTTMEQTNKSEQTVNTIPIERETLDRLVQMVDVLRSIAKMHADHNPIAKHIDYARLADDAQAVLNLIGEEMR